MISILLVEDNQATLEQWEVMFKTFLPDSQILLATTAEECQNIIDSRRRADQPINIVVLDAMIPDTSNSVPAVHPLLASNIGGAFPNALIIHCTAYYADSEVKKRLEGELNELDKGRHLLVDKGSANYCETIERLSMQHLFEPPIYRRMTLLFGPAPKSVRHPGTDLSGVGGGYHVTRELSALMTDIRLSWPNLSDNFRIWIKEHLVITEDHSGQILISLLPAIAANEKREAINESCLHPKNEVVPG